MDEYDTRIYLKTNYSDQYYVQRNRHNRGWIDYCDYDSFERDLECGKQFRNGEYCRRPLFDCSFHPYCKLCLSEKHHAKDHYCSYCKKLGHLRKDHCNKCRKLVHTEKCPIRQQQHANCMKLLKQIGVVMIIVILIYLALLMIVISD